ncbi:MAG: NAD(P)H-dependent oxidoreductase [Symploca sp. SIO2E9]|nr:NAD(P)H-dependent oxidoreductase [Symploca sp. SIO2E9]
MQNSLKVLILSGSIRRPSYTFSVADAIKYSLQEQGCSCLHWNLTKQPLPIADPAYHSRPHDNPNDNAKKLAREADSSDIIILATPIYHNSYSGVLKNALDLLTMSQFQYKAIGLVSHGGNRSTQGVDQLRIVVRGLLGYAITTQVCTMKSDYGSVDNDGIYPISDPTIHERINRFVRELILLAPVYRALRQRIGLLPSEFK